MVFVYRQSEFAQHRRQDQSEVAEPRLSVGAAATQSKQSIQDAPLASLCERIPTFNLVWWKQAPDCLECVKVLFVKMACLRHEHPPQASNACHPSHTSTDQVGTVLAIPQRGKRIEHHIPAHTRNNQISPPIVSRHLHIGACCQKGSSRGLVEHHGVATGDALHQGVLESCRTSITGRLPHELVVGINQRGAAAVQSGDIWVLLIQPPDCALQLVCIPDVVLICVRIVVTDHQGVADHRQKICCKPQCRTFEHDDLTG